METCVCILFYRNFDHLLWALFLFLFLSCVWIIYARRDVYFLYVAVHLSALWGLFVCSLTLFYVSVLLENQNKYWICLFIFYVVEYVIFSVRTENVFFMHVMLICMLCVCVQEWVPEVSVSPPGRARSFPGFITRPSWHSSSVAVTCGDWAGGTHPIRRVCRAHTPSCQVTSVLHIPQ